MTFSQLEVPGLIVWPRCRVALHYLYSPAWPGGCRGVRRTTPWYFPQETLQHVFSFSATNLICGSELFLNGHLSPSRGSGCNVGALERLLQGSLRTLIPIFLSF